MAKALVNYVRHILVVLILMISCTKVSNDHKESIIIKKITIENDFSAVEKPWGISDGLKIIREKTIEYFVFEIESPPGVVRKNAEIHFTYRIDSSNVTLYEKEITFPIDGLFPFYNLNSLEAFNVNDRYGVYFFTSLLDYPYGIDPFELVMWIYYDDNIYRFSGIVPPHGDWPWEEVYLFNPDEHLKAKYLDVYNTMTLIWDDHIEKYK